MEHFTTITFFLFLVNCCFLQYVTELFVYNFYPFIALEHYKKILGDSFYYDEDTDILMPEEDGGLYDIAEFINYGIRMTAAFLDYQKDLLQCDFDMLLMKDKLFAEYDTLQYLYLMESKDNMHDTYTGTSFNAHLMPVSVHAFNHLDIVYKILDENMSVREVYDINSVQDWRTQKHTAGWTPENVLCIFPRKNLPNEAKLPVRNVSCAKKDRFPLRNFRLGWMRVSVDKFALPQNSRIIIVRLVINLL